MGTSTSRPLAAILSRVPPCVAMSTPSRRTCKPETKPAPKIFTPDKLHVPAGEPGGGTQVSVACGRSEEHTSELQSPDQLVCRLLLENKRGHVAVSQDNLDTT